MTTCPPQTKSRRSQIRNFFLRWVPGSRSHSPTEDDGERGGVVRGKRWGNESLSHSHRGQSAQAEVNHSAGGGQPHNGGSMEGPSTKLFTLSHPSRGFFPDSQPIFNGNVTMNDYIVQGKTVFQHLDPYTNPDAAVDSGARYPPPSCHPRTRISLGNRLLDWLDDGNRERNAQWLYGLAGTGKSAIAQTFAEKCKQQGRLGGAFFFSRPNNRNNPVTVLPTIAYDFARHCPDYLAALARQLDKDPKLPSRAFPTQFQLLIVEPLLEIRARGSRSIEKPFVIILDGLDECSGRDAQCDFIELITTEALSHRDLPILWLICSRPEAHLQQAFAGVALWGHAELTFDEECRSDVACYFKEALEEVRIKYISITGPFWPPRAQIDAILEYASGLFVFVAVVVAFVSDSEFGNPVKRLNTLFSYLARAPTALNAKPLEKLDVLYLLIFNDISGETLMDIRIILSHFIGISASQIAQPPSAQALCNLVKMDQATFYGAMQNLYSVFHVPFPEDARHQPLRSYHASIQDFLLDGLRSGSLAIKKEEAVNTLAKSCLFWHELDSSLYHVDDSLRSSDRSHQHTPLPGLTWALEEHQVDISTQVADLAKYSWQVCNTACKFTVSQDLLDYLSRLNFKSVALYDLITWVELVNFLYEQDSTPGLIRTEPLDDADAQLLGYIKMMTSEDVSAVSFPVGHLWWRGRIEYRKYLLIGQGSNSVGVWFTTCGYSEQNQRVDSVGFGQEPSHAQIEEYRKWLQEKGWRGGEMLQDII